VPCSPNSFLNGPTFPWVALIALPYYMETNHEIVQTARKTIDAIIADFKSSF